MFFYNSPLGVLKIQLKNHQIYSLSKSIISKKTKDHFYINAHNKSYTNKDNTKFLTNRNNKYYKNRDNNKNQQAEINENQDPIIQKTVLFLDHYFLHYKKNQLVSDKKQFENLFPIKQIKFGSKEQSFLKNKNLNRRDIILFNRGTDFQRKVWQELIKIPYGQTWTYGEVAKAIGSPKAVRAVGSACACNPYLILVPCHRVVSKKGLGGFALGLTAKKKLLKYENS